jgi:FtsH-binding integral membrane protein
MPSLSQRLQGIGLLVGGVVAGLAAVYLVVNPGAFVRVHPVPLLVLLLATAAIAFWQARLLLR